jgi:hypothetical protein
VSGYQAASIWDFSFARSRISAGVPPSFTWLLTLNEMLPYRIAP